MNIRNPPIYIILLISLILIKFLGPVYVTIIDWTLIINNILDASIVFVVFIIISNRLLSKIKNITLKKTLTQILFIISILVAFSMFFDNILSIGVTFGLVGFGLTLIFQNPILSFAAWTYVMIANIYREGDRIKVGNFKGDVVDINFFRTKIIEVGGDYLTSDVMSGRIIYFPNSIVLSEPLFNYNKYFKYIWAEVPITLAYESDFKSVQEIAQKVLTNYLKKDLEEIKNSFEKAMKKLDFKKEFNAIIINLDPKDSWVELRVNFPVLPTKMSDATTEIAEKLIEEFKKNSDKVKMPEGIHR